MNKNRFQALCSGCCSCGEATDSADLYQELASHYAEPHRHYHTGNHIDRCLEQFDLTKQLMNAPDAVEMALWFHDAIYDLKARDNEQQSADLFLAWLGDPADTLFDQRVVELILFTTHQQPPPPGDGQYMVDIDLASFGQPWPRCRQDAVAIRTEHADQADTAFFSQQKRFLQALLDRPSIYASEWFRDRYETQARDNIRRLMAITSGADL